MGEKSIPHFAVDIRPYTGEILCKKEQRVHHFLELAKQAIKTGSPRRAKLLQSLKLEKKDLTKKQLHEIVQFLKTVYTEEGAEAAIKLKFIYKLKASSKKMGIIASCAKD